MFIKLKATGIKVGDQRLEPVGPPIKVEMLRLWVEDLQSPRDRSWLLGRNSEGRRKGANQSVMLGW